MSLFNTMQTSVSGMAAQANALGTIGDNIANSGTTGYKDATAQFSTILGQSGASNYESGGVQTNVRYNVTAEGALTNTTSPTDLAVNGNGFFVVSQNGQGTYMTRAGSFVPDSSGNLVNAAGYQLMGYAIGADGTASQTLTPVNVSSTSLQFAVSTTGTLVANVPATAATVTPAAASAGPPATPAVDLPSSNTAASTYTKKTSITAYDSLGAPVLLDVYLTKTGDNEWEATAYPAADASANGGFPYTNGGTADTGAGPTTMTFDPTTGALTSGSTLDVTLPSGANTVAIDLSGMTQLATAWGVTTATANGNSPSKVSNVAVGKDGTLTEVYASGVQIKTYDIPLATVASPDMLTPLSGNVYQVSQGSGDMILSAPQTNGAGAIDSQTLEGSTVDLATELTNMIVAQRAYEANSKVLQAGSDLLGVLNRLSTN